MEINLDTRKIQAPEFLSVEKDHQAETVYFCVDRFYDNIDLSTKTCLVQYINAAGEGRIYPVPFMDITTKAKEDKMIFPWVIGREATKEAGVVKFSVQFYEVDPITKLFTYNLYTQPATSKVLYGMQTNDDEAYDYPADFLQEILDRVSRIEGNYHLYWVDAF